MMSLVALSSAALLFYGTLAALFIALPPLAAIPVDFGIPNLTHVVTSAGATLAVGTAAYAIASFRGKVAGKQRRVLFTVTAWSGFAAIVGWFVPYPYVGTVTVPAVAGLFLAFRHPVTARITSRALTPIAPALFGALLAPILLSLATIGAASTDGSNVLYLLSVAMFRHYLAPMAVFLGLQLAILALVLSGASPPPEQPVQAWRRVLLGWISPVIAVGIGLPISVRMAGDCVLDFCFGSFLLVMVVFPIVLAALNLTALLLWGRDEGGGRGMGSSPKSEPVYP